MSNMQHTMSSMPGMDETLNETAILKAHGPDPMSFYDFDYESDSNSKPGWMILHAIGMSISFGLLLPIGEYSFIYSLWRYLQSRSLRLGVESVTQ